MLIQNFETAGFIDQQDDWFTGNYFGSQQEELHDYA